MIAARYDGTKAIDLIQHARSLSAKIFLPLNMLLGVLTLRDTYRGTSKYTRNTIDCIFGMQQYIQACPLDHTGLQVYALLLEAHGSAQFAADINAKAAKCLEDLYEDSEIEEILNSFCQSKAVQSRLELSQNQLSDALESANTVLSLLGDCNQLRETRLTALLVTCIVNIIRGPNENVPQHLEVVRSQTAGNPDVAELLARLLYYEGSRNSCKQLCKFAIRIVTEWFNYPALDRANYKLSSKFTASRAFVAPDIHTCASPRVHGSRG